MRSRKITKDEAAEKAAKAERELVLYRSALTLAMTGEGIKKRNRYGRMIVGPVRFDGDRVAIVFARESGRLLKNGKFQGDWAAYWWSALGHARLLANDQDYCQLFDEMTLALADATAQVT